MKYLESKTDSIEESILKMWEKAAKQAEDNTNDKSDDGEGLDKVQPKAVKKKFADRKDKDIDNDGDVDDSDEFLHKRRKAVSKAMEKEGNAFTGALKAAKDKGEDEFVVAGKKYKVKEVEEKETLDSIEIFDFEKINDLDSSQIEFDFNEAKRSINPEPQMPCASELFIVSYF